MTIQLLGKKYSTSELLRKKTALIKELEENGSNVKKRVLILSGSTVGEIEAQLKLFCLAKGIELEVTQGEYNRYYEEAVYGLNQSMEFVPDFIYVHISNRNILEWPEPYEDAGVVKERINRETQRLKAVLEGLLNRYECPIICNNYEYLSYRTLGNKDVWDESGLIYYVNAINQNLYGLIREMKRVYIQDIQYLSSYYGLKEWANPSYWYKYKYALALEAIPYLAQNLAAIIASLSGLNKKCVAVDLDNTLWGGVIGDDGVDGISYGNDSATGEAFAEFQYYLKRLQKAGLLIAVVSKNEEDIAKPTFAVRDMELQLEDFVEFVANWEVKSQNIVNLAKKMNLGIDAYGFIDDNPMERDEVRTNVPMVEVPELSRVESYIEALEESHLFESTIHTSEDTKRTDYYRQNAIRQEEESKFENYEEYLKSLEMDWQFTSFERNSVERIVQLINKTNQFNLTTLRLNLEDVNNRMDSSSYVCIQGKMKDKFGDNGIVTLLIGRVEDGVMDIELWTMSCRVFRRNGEYLLFDYLLNTCKELGVKEITGKYIPSKKNGIVANFYQNLGFEKVAEEDGSTEWRYVMSCVREGGL